MTQTSTTNVLGKRCPRCHEQKPLTDFYRNRGKLLGVASFCKPCHAASIAPWMESHKEKLREYQRNWLNKHRDEHNAQERARRALLPPEKFGGRETTFDRWAAERPAFWLEMRHAHDLVHNAVRTGRLTKGTQCENCGTTEKRIEAAHYDYTEPLRVRWLCKSCHIRWDMASPKTRRGAAS